MKAAAVFLLAAVALTAEPFQLAKLVFTLSRPGAFNKTHSVFGGELDAPPDVTSCPLGQEGLACRQAEARRVIDNCPGGVKTPIKPKLLCPQKKMNKKRGDCEGCDFCDETRASAWPRCCQQNNMCCSELARACQTCKVIALQMFCNKHFKRCF